MSRKLIEDPMCHGGVWLACLAEQTSPKGLRVGGRFAWDKVDRLLVFRALTGRLGHFSASAARAALVLVPIATVLEACMVQNHITSVPLPNAALRERLARLARLWHPAPGGYATNRTRTAGGSEPCDSKYGGSNMAHQAKIKTLQRQSFQRGGQPRSRGC